MPSPFGTPHRWRERAEEARATAKNVAVPGTKLVMLRVAETYEGIAERVEALTASSPRKD